MYFSLLAAASSAREPFNFMVQSTFQCKQHKLQKFKILAILHCIFISFFGLATLPPWAIDPFNFMVERTLQCKQNKPKSQNLSSISLFSCLFLNLLLFTLGLGTLFISSCGAPLIASYKKSKS